MEKENAELMRLKLKFDFHKNNKNRHYQECHHITIKESNSYLRDLSKNAFAMLIFSHLLIADLAFTPAMEKSGTEWSIFAHISSFILLGALVCTVAKNMFYLIESEKGE